jgi:hypothetical protein
MTLISSLRRLRSLVNTTETLSQLQGQSMIASEQQMLILGKLLSESVKSRKHIASLNDVEFKIFSQWGDDGIIQWLTGVLEFPNRTFAEFGVANYRESNTRFLMMNDNWSGLVMDGSDANVAQIVGSEYFWKYQLEAKAAFIDTDNINALLEESLIDREVGILHIDLDGNDYWIWETIDVVDPIVVILEYNSLFGADRAITAPYAKDFDRTKAHYSNLYWGASLGALYQLSVSKGYVFIGCNSAGNNAYFVRKDKLNDSVREVSLEDGYVLCAFRESRDREGRLTYLTGADRIDAIRGMPVHNVETGQTEEL